MIRNPMICPFGQNYKNTFDYNELISRPIAASRHSALGGLVFEVAACLLSLPEMIGVIKYLFTHLDMQDKAAYDKVSASFCFG